MRQKTLISLLSALLGLALLLPAGAHASKSQWSIFEDSRHLVTYDRKGRQQTLDEIAALGADTIRVTLRWDTVAPATNSTRRPSRFNASDPAAYPGFGPYDELIQSANGMGFRILISITGHTPRWARAGKSSLKGGYPVTSEFRQFVTAVVTRYSGRFAGLPKITNYAIWHEPNQPGWLAPQSVRGRPVAPKLYRNMVRAAYPAIKAVQRDALVIIGQLAPSGRNGHGKLTALRPLEFLRAFGCRNKRFKRVRGGACRGFQPAKGDAFGLHPYSTYARFLSPNATSPAADDAAIGDSRRFLKTLDRLTARRAILNAKGGRFNVYFTEFGVQTNPPDPFQTASPSKQAQFINRAEEFGYRFPRIKSYSQYELYDEGPLKGARSKRWSGFQMGLRFWNGGKKSSYESYKYPLVVRRSSRRSVAIWGRVRPKAGGTRFVQVQQNRGGSRYRDSGGKIQTNSDGYFTVRRVPGVYRFIAYARAKPGDPLRRLGQSRTAGPSG